MFTLNQPGGDGEVIETPLHLALMEGRGDTDGTIHLYAGTPEHIVKVYLRKRHLLNLLGRGSKRYDSST